MCEKNVNCCRKWNVIFFKFYSTRMTVDRFAHNRTPRLEIKNNCKVWNYYCFIDITQFKSNFNLLTCRPNHELNDTISLGLIKKSISFHFRFDWQCNWKTFNKQLAPIDPNSVVRWLPMVHNRWEIQQVVSYHAGMWCGYLTALKCDLSFYYTRRLQWEHRDNAKWYHWGVLSHLGAISRREKTLFHRECVTQ